MAVNKITNKHVVSKESINRAEQVSTRNLTVRDNKNIPGTRVQRLSNPGIDVTKNYAVTLKDVDTAIMNHIKNVLRPKIVEANETVDIPVMYGNEERWATVRKRGVIRDKNNALILPLIMIRRTALESNELTDIDYGHDVKNEYITITRNNLWSKDNRYDRFSVQTGKKPAYEAVTTGIPNYRTCVYDVIIWTAYIEQMNPILELFVEEEGKYWGDSNDYKFQTSIDTFSDASELTVDSERIIKTTFNLNTKAYLLPEYINSTLKGKFANFQKELTPSRVVFGFEGDATNKQVGK